MYNSRRNILAGIANVFGVYALSSCANPSNLNSKKKPRIAITIDDFVLNDTILLSATERDDAILFALKNANLRAAGFPAGRHIENEKGSISLNKWANAGHIIGNHSYSHKYYSGDDPQAMIADILRCEELLKNYPSFAKLFRYPYLAEGKTLAGRDALRALLRDNNYRPAHVTIDTSDWYIDNRLNQKLAQKPNLDIGPYRDFYLNHIWERAQFYDNLANMVFGHSIDHTIVLHHNLTSALFLGDLLKMFVQNGWGLCAADIPFNSIEFQSVFTTVPTGQSLVWAGAKQKDPLANLRYPAEDGDYEKPKMDSLGL